MSSIFFKNKDLFLEVSKTESGPNTDGKAKRKNQNENIEKSFNLVFCKNYFLAEEVRKSYFYYVLLVFGHFDINELIEKFQFKCCDSLHDVVCIEK